MANQLRDLLMANDRRLLKKILDILMSVVLSAVYYLVLIVVIGALEMVGINSNILNRCLEAIFGIFVGVQLFALVVTLLVVKKNFASTDKFLADIDRLLSNRGR